MGHGLWAYAGSNWFNCQNCWVFCFTNIQDPSSFLPEFRGPFPVAPPPLGFRLYSAESVFQCLQACLGYGFMGQQVVRSTNLLRTEAMQRNRMGKFRHFGCKKPSQSCRCPTKLQSPLSLETCSHCLCLGLGPDCFQSTRTIQFHVCLVFQGVLMNKAQGKVDQSFGGAILSDSFPKKVGWIW